MSGTTEHALLPRVPLFAGLDRRTLDEVAAAARLRTIEAGERLFGEGDPAEAFFVIQTGSVKLTQLSPEGHQIVLRVIGPGDPCGGVAAFGGLAYPVGAEALNDVCVYEWAGPVMADLMERHARLAVNALRLVAERLHELQVQYRHLATERVERRVARALIRLSAQAGRPVEGGMLIDLRLSRDDIAQMTGTTLYTVSRIVSGWEARGILESGRQRVVVRRPEALTAIAEE